MHALSSRQIGEVFNDLRDRLPQHGREVRMAIKLRTDYDGPIKRPSRKVPPPRPIAKDEAAMHREAQRAALRDILRGLHFSKFGTGPKLTVKRPKPVFTPAPHPPVLLLTDQRSARRKRLQQTKILGPVPNSALEQRIAHINAAMAVQFGPWLPRVQALTYEVIYV
jgi:hypothetical protein